MGGFGNQPLDQAGIVCHRIGKTTGGAQVGSIEPRGPVQGFRWRIFLMAAGAGQAVQAMNIMFGLDERSGLGGVALLP